MARILLGLLALALLASPAPASASEHLGDRDVGFLSLKVNGRGEALVSYRRADGARRDVLIWGAVNAHAPDADRPQVQLSVRLQRRLEVARHRAVRPLVQGHVPRVRRSAARPPRRRLQGARRVVLGVAELAEARADARFRARSAPSRTPIELHVSHWSGPLPALEVSPNWTYGGTLQGLFGRLTYRGEAVYGFRTPSATRRDPYARFVYIDTFNSVYGPGWKRDTGIVTHRRNGAFCYSFVAQAPPPGYPSREPRGPGNGERHRVTVMGPGVTPVVQWEGEGLRRYNAAVGPGVQQALRPAGRAERQGLRARALAHGETLEPFRLLADHVDPVHSRAARPLAGEVDEPLDGVALALEHRLDGPVGQVPRPAGDTGRLRAAAGRLAKEDALDMTLDDDAAALHGS